jgi:hypothetical protein
MASVPRYETEAERPSLASTGFARISEDEIAAIGMSDSQLIAFLRKHGAEDVETRNVEPDEMIDTEWIALHGRPVPPEAVKGSMERGMTIARGRDLGAAVESAREICQAIRKVDLVAVFIDFE